MDILQILLTFTSKSLSIKFSAYSWTISEIVTVFIGIFRIRKVNRSISNYERLILWLLLLYSRGHKNTKIDPTPVGLLSCQLL